MSMFEIWIGKLRDIDGESRREIRLMITVEFIRKHLRYFRGAKYAVFTVIAGHMDDTGWSWPSNPLICEESGYSDKNTVSGAITLLSKLRIEGRRVLIVMQRKNNKGLFMRNEYLVFPTDKESALFDTGKLTRPDRPYRDSPDTVQPDTVNPPRSIESNTPDSKESTITKDISVAGNTAPKTGKYPLSDEVKNAFAVVCYGNKNAWDLNASIMGNALKKLTTYEKRSLTLDDLREFRQWWKKSDWRGKQQQLPEPYTVVSVWARFRAGEDSTEQLTPEPPKPPAEITRGKKRG